MEEINLKEIKEKSPEQVREENQALREEHVLKQAEILKRITTAISEKRTAEEISSVSYPPDFEFNGQARADAWRHEIGITKDIPLDDK